MPYRMMQVGLGDFGRRWLRIVHAHESWQYSALATRNEQIRNRCGLEVGLGPEALFGSVDEAIESGLKADAALVTTPNFRHRHEVAMLLEQGMHVLVEKPVAGTWEDCLAIRDAAREAPGVLMVGENYRFGEGARIAHELVQSGAIGTPEFLSMDYFVGHEFPDGDWRNDYTYPLLIENSTHQFDLVRYVTATEPESVYCNAFFSARTPHWPLPTVSAQFAMSNGFHFQFSASWAYRELQTPWEGVWRLYGSEGALSWTQDRIEVHSNGDVRAIDVPSKDSDHTLSATFAEFSAAVTEERAPVPDIEDNMHTVAMVFGAIRSHETGSPVSIVEMLSETSSAPAKRASGQ